LLEQREVATLEVFDLVMGIGVLHHLDDTTARQFMAIAKAALKPGGCILTLDPCFAAGQNPIARFLIARDRGQHVRNADGYLALADRTCLDATSKVVHQAWIPYTHWIMESRARA
jgi:SAM-dependent methyltransferase